MKDNTSQKKENKKTKTDYFTKLMLLQSFLAAVIFGLFFFLSADDGSYFRRDYEKFSAWEIFDTLDALETVREYFSSNASWAVFGDQVLYSENSEKEESVTDGSEEPSSAADESEASETTVSQESDTDDQSDQTEEAKGQGGEDLQIYKAQANTSFAPVKLTAPILPPIKNGRFTSGFGYRINPITGKFSFHTGLDIAAESGTNIRAVLNGTVLKTGEDERAGKYILLSHSDSLVTFYCHCSDILAEKGAVIRQGETLAKVGSTGWSTGPHLHFEVRKDGIRYNPAWLLGDS
ncbi:MAG: M23 family metallopeptidase [Acutalibacteraceae bacterium]